MSVVKDLIVAGDDGSLCFGDYELSEKAKKSGFEVKGDSYKVKTYRASTRLERNDSLVYESEPGTAVQDFTWNENGVSFTVECPGDCQIVLGLTDDDPWFIKRQQEQLTPESQKMVHLFEEFMLYKQQKVTK